MNKRFLVLCSCILTLLVLSACAVKPLQINYYRLSPTQLSVESAGLDRLIIGVGPVTLPDLLKKSRIATRIDNQRYYYHEQHRWAGLVDEDIAAVVGDNIGALLGTDQVVFYPWKNYARPDYRVAINIIRLDGDLDGDAYLSVRWSIVDQSGKQLLLAGKSDFRQVLSEPTYKSLVAAQSILLGAFCQELAGHIKTLYQP